MYAELRCWPRCSLRSPWKSYLPPWALGAIQAAAVEGDEQGLQSFYSVNVVAMQGAFLQPDFSPVMMDLNVSFTLRQGA